MADTLRDLAVGEAATVVGFAEHAGAFRRRLLSMGLTPGARLEVARYAPMGDPIEVRVRGFSLSLRREEASALRVERADP